MFFLTPKQCDRQNRPFTCVYGMETYNSRNFLHLPAFGVESGPWPSLNAHTNSLYMRETKKVDSNAVAGRKQTAHM